MSLAERFADDISLQYSLVDRMRVRGRIMNLQTITMLRTYFQRIRGVEWIEQEDLRQATTDFVLFIERFAEDNDVPLIKARPGENHVEQAAQYLDRVADKKRAVYCIIKVQEETSSFVSYVPKQGDRERKPEFGVAIPSASPATRPSRHRFFVSMDITSWPNI